ncbi:hypothetical protein AGIG_G13587 [Arapaima gigas]
MSKPTWRHATGTQPLKNCSSMADFLMLGPEIYQVKRVNKKRCGVKRCAKRLTGDSDESLLRKTGSAARESDSCRGQGWGEGTGSSRWNRDLRDTWRAS